MRDLKRALLSLVPLWSLPNFPGMRIHSNNYIIYMVIQMYWLEWTLWWDLGMPHFLEHNRDDLFLFFFFCLPWDNRFVDNSHRNWGEVVKDLSSPVVGLHSVGRFTSGRFCCVCLGTGEFLRPQGAIPPSFYPLEGGYFLAPEAPLIRGMPTGPKVFLALLDACGLRPCHRTHLKNGFVPHSYVGETYDK